MCEDAECGKERGGAGGGGKRSKKVHKRTETEKKSVKKRLFQARAISKSGRDGDGKKRAECATGRMSSIHRDVNACRAQRFLRKRAHRSGDGEANRRVCGLLREKEAHGRVEVGGKR